MKITDTQLGLTIGFIASMLWLRFMETGVKNSFDFWIYSSAAIGFVIVPFVSCIIIEKRRLSNG